MFASNETPTGDMRRRPRLRDDVQFTPQRRQADLFWHVSRTSSSRCFRIGAADYALLSLLDGTTTLAEAATLLARQLGDAAPTRREIEATVAWLETNGLLAGSAESSTTVAVSRRSVMWWPIPLPLPPSWLSPAGRAAAQLLTVPGMLFWGLLLVVALVNVVTHFQAMFATPRAWSSPSMWLLLVGTWLALKVVHEASHAVVCQYYGAPVREWGIVLMAGAPAAYVDVSAAWMLPARWQRMHISLAGMQGELCVATVAAACWSPELSPWASQLLINVIGLATLTTILFNANPLLRYDGYYVLSDVMDLPNLSSAGCRARLGLLAACLGWPRENTRREVGWRQHVVLGYGVAAWMAQVFVATVFVLAASVCWQGAGILLSLAALATWYGPVVQTLGRELWRQSTTAPQIVVQAIARTAACLVALCLCGFYLPSPWARTCYGVVELSPAAAILRAPADGQLIEFFVAEGQQVEAGQTLMLLRNDELRQQLIDTQFRLEQALARRRHALEQGEFGEVRREEHIEESLSRHHAALQQRCEALSITAPRSGRVHSRLWRDSLGRWMKEGDELALVYDGSDVEFVAALPQSQIASVATVGQQSQSIMFLGNHFGQGTLSEVSTYAAVNGFPPALTASAGGPLASEWDGVSSSGPRLLTPAFRLRWSLAPSTTPWRVGQRGRIALGRDVRPLLVAAWQGSTTAISDWLEELYRNASR